MPIMIYAAAMLQPNETGYKNNPGVGTSWQPGSWSSQQTQKTSNVHCGDWRAVQAISHNQLLHAIKNNTLSTILQCHMFQQPHQPIHHASDSVTHQWPRLVEQQHIKLVATDGTHQPCSAFTKKAHTHTHCTNMNPSSTHSVDSH
jgi:hypothetical protein